MKRCRIAICSCVIAAFSVPAWGDAPDSRQAEGFFPAPVRQPSTPQPSPTPEPTRTPVPPCTHFAVTFSPMETRYADVSGTSYIEREWPDVWKYTGWLSWYGLNADHMLSTSGPTPACLNTLLRQRIQACRINKYTGAEVQAGEIDDCVVQSLYEGLLSEDMQWYNRYTGAAATEIERQCTLGYALECSLYSTPPAIDMGATVIYVDAGCQPTNFSPASICGAADYRYIRDDWDEVLVTRIGKGCLPPEAEVLMADGHTKRADQVFAGEAVWNPVTQKAERIGRVKEGPEQRPLVEIIGDRFHARVTQKHIVLTEAGPKQAKNLTLSDRVIDGFGRPQRVTKIGASPAAESQRVFNFYFEADRDADAEHYFVTDQIVTGNLRLQEKLDEEN